MPKSHKEDKVFIAVDLNGRREGVVLGIFDDLEKARLYASNTAAHITIYEAEATKVE